MSVELVNPDFSPTDKTIMTNTVLTGVALVGIRHEPANKNTYAELLKSVTKQQLFNEILRRAEGSLTFRNHLEQLVIKHKL